MAKKMVFKKSLKKDHGVKDADVDAFLKKIGAESGLLVVKIKSGVLAIARNIDPRDVPEIADTSREASKMIVLSAIQKIAPGVLKQLKKLKEE